MDKKIFLLVFGMFLLIGAMFYVSSLISFSPFGPSGTASVSSLQKGLVGHWTLDEINYNSNTNRVTDKSAYSNHGTNYGATFSSDRHGNSNGAMSFDGTNDYIDLPNDVGYTDEFSAFAWFKQSGSPPGNYHIIFGGAELEISISSSTGAIRTGVSTNVDRYVSNHGSGLLDGKWHLVGVTFEGTNKSSWIDGEYVGDDVTSGTLDYSFSNRRIGRFGSSGTYYANGDVSNLKIYDRALSANEIDLLYARGRY